MKVQRIAAFPIEGRGGNPAGVVLCDELPPADDMQALAREVGYSETVFAAPDEENWRVRYFAPAAEIPFCGHATIALGAVLARTHGNGVFRLKINDGRVSVDGYDGPEGMSATLTSPSTQSEPAPAHLLETALQLFDLQPGELDIRLPPAIIQAGARHLLLAFRDRARLARMQYDMTIGAVLMRDWRFATISLVNRQSQSLFHARNPFAGGGVYEDPATGAAAAALGGYLRDLGAFHSAPIEIVQGEDMGVPCLIQIEIPPGRGQGVRVSGAARLI